MCSFQDYRKICCGSSRGCSELKKLLECEDEIWSYLQSYNLSMSGLKECDLILARAGIFGLDQVEIESMMVCPKHRHQLGRFWRAPRSCQYPSHSGPRKKQCKDRHVINMAIAVEVQSVFKVTVGIGSREYCVMSYLNCSLFLFFMITAFLSFL